MKIKCETAVHSDSEAQNKEEIKEESLVLGIGLENDESFPSLDAMKIKNNSDVDEMVSRMVIKEELWWQESTSTEVISPKEEFISDLHVYNKTKYGANGDLCATESIRLHTEAHSSTSRATPYSFTATDVEGKDSLKLRKDNLEFSEASLHEVYESDFLVYREKMSYKCDLCGKSFIRNAHLNRHILIHQGKRPFKCEDCEKSFLRMEDLKRHILIHQGKRIYKCDVCQKSFTRKGDLSIHTLIHQGKKLYKCDICGKTFTQNAHLITHIRIHEGKRPFKCDVCEKSFTEKGTLKKHILIHQDKTLIKCDVCEKGFTQKGSLKIHMQIHQGKTPFKCYVCEKSFTQKGNLKRHILIHQCQRSIQM